MAAPYIKVGDDLLQDGIMESVRVDQELNQHWSCEIVCRQTEDTRVPVEDYLGRDLQIIASLDDEAEQMLFDGFVLDVELDYEINGSFTAINPSGVGSSWCGSTFVATGSFALTAAATKLPDLWPFK